MDDQKIENLLNLSLDATGEERRKSENLEVGFDEQSGAWEVIIRYSGNLRDVILPGWKIVFLSGGYAIVTLPQEEVNILASLPQVEYVEKPKRLYFGVDTGRAASCINPVQTGAYTGKREISVFSDGNEFGQIQEGTQGLFGSGILTAVIDSGVDYFHPDFRNEDGSSRILYLWDQTAVYADNTPAGRIPKGFADGTEYTKEEIDRALTAGSRTAGLALVPEQDQSGHGTQVLGIAAGNGRASGGRFRGIAPLSDIIVVKLGTAREQGFPRTTELMRAIEYVYQKAAELGMPMAVNISFGNVYGSHRGNSLLETYMNLMAAKGRSVIAVGTGNEGNAGGHASGRFLNTEERSRTDNTGNLLLEGEAEKYREIELLISDFETSLNLQIWKNYADEIRISLIHPNGSIAGPFGQEIGASRYLLGNTELLIYYGEPNPYQAGQEIYIDFIPTGTYIDSGVWRVLLTPVQVVDGRYEMWLPDFRARNQGTRFLQPDADVTMTIPSAASQMIAVGAYDSRRNVYASFSGRGWPDDTYQIRPDLAAPGVEITTTAAGGNYVRVTGTSFATPFVTGSAALMMEWGEGGIIRLRQKSREISGYPQ